MTAGAVAVAVVSPPVTARPGDGAEAAGVIAAEGSRAALPIASAASKELRSVVSSSSGASAAAATLSALAPPTPVPRPIKRGLRRKVYTATTEKTFTFPPRGTPESASPKEPAPKPGGPQG